MKHLLLLGLALAGCVQPPAPPARPAPVPSDAPSLRVSSLERGVHDATNVARRRERLGALGYDDALAAVARRHSADMARRGYFAHDAPDGSDVNARAARDGLTCRVTTGRQTRVGFAENLAQVWRYSRWRETRSAAGTRRTYDWRTPAEIVRETVDGWLGSPGHRRNLLGPASREGVGVAISGDGAVYVTQVLC